MAGRRHYCSYFDHRYLARGLAMIRSLRRFDPDALFWVLCLNEQCEQALARLGEPNVRAIAMGEFMRGDLALEAARADRSAVEFYFTCTPSIVLHILRRAGDDDTVTYVDGDLYFFASPQPLFDALGDMSVSIIPHRFPAAQRDLERFGIYNVGWLSFRNDARAHDVASWWRERCNEWCRDQVEDDRYADQKYLDRFATLFPGVVAIGHPGANLAPWNVARHDLSLGQEGIRVDGEPLIFFHFQGLRELGRNLYFAAHDQYDAPLTPFIRRNIYRPYLETLSAIRDEIAPVIGMDAETPLWRGAAEGGFFARIKARLQRPKRYMRLFLKGQAIRVRSSTR